MDGVLVLPPGADQPQALESTAAELWHLLAAPATVDELVEAMADLHGVGPEVVDDDVRSFVARLADLEAIVAAHRDGGGPGRR